MKQHIPNLFTLSNLLCGCLAVVSLIYGKYNQAVYLVIGAFVADALDGQIARWLQVSGPLGKQLDSLADMVSFGVVPGAILYMLLLETKMLPSEREQLMVRAMPAFIVTLFSALRLAKFNIDTRQTDTFLGLATPANTVFLCGVLWMYANGDESIRQMIKNVPLLYAFIPILSYLLVSEIPMMNFRFKGFGWKENEFRFIFLIGLPLIGLLFPIGFFALSIVWYVLVSIIHNIFATKKA